MRPIQNAGGHVGLTAREYEIATGTAVSAGQVVKLSGGLVVLAAANETGKILGIAAENHPGTADALNPRANGTKLRVYDNPELISECPVPVITADATNSSATVVSAATGQIAATIANDSFNGGMLILKSKASGSTNTDHIGMKKRVTDYALTNLALTVASGGAAYTGDAYELYPPIGSAVCGLDSGISKAIVSATGATVIKIVGHDYDRHMIRVMAALHSLGVEE